MIQNYFDNVKRILGSLISNARAREGWGKSLHLLEATVRPRSGQKRAGKKEGVLGEGIFARPLVLSSGCAVAEGDAQVRSRRGFVQSRFGLYLINSTIDDFFRPRFARGSGFGGQKIFSPKAKRQNEIF